MSLHVFFFFFKVLYKTLKHLISQKVYSFPKQSFLQLTVFNITLCTILFMIYGLHR